MNNNNDKYDGANFTSQCGCGSGVLSYAKGGLCELCTAQELVSHMVESWIVKMQQSQCLHQGINLAAAADFDLRLKITNAILDYVKSLPPAMYPILQANYTLPLHKRKDM